MDAQVHETDDVRCLDCGSTYSKPAGGGTMRRNPGCPRCGYVGWVALSRPDPDEQPRSAAGRLQHLHVQPR